MAVKVTPQRGMNGYISKTYEEATSFRRDSQGYLLVMKGAKVIAQHAAGTWEAAEILDLLDQKKAKKAEKSKVPVGGFEPKKGKSKSGPEIRTSPDRTRAPRREGGKVKRTR